MTPFHKLHGMTRRRKVHEYMVWRAGQSVDWQCSQGDIAREVGLDKVTVRTICAAKGWECRYEPRNDDRRGFGRPSIDRLMGYGIDARAKGRERF